MTMVACVFESDSDSSALLMVTVAVSVPATVGVAATLVSRKRKRRSRSGSRTGKALNQDNMQLRALVDEKTHVDYFAEWRGERNATG